MADTMARFRVQTYSATANISKVYKSGVRYDDVLRIYSRREEPDRLRVLISIKPKTERQGLGMLAEIQNNKLVSAYRFVAETKKAMPVSSRQRSSNVVIGGLSLQDFQMIQGLSPFAEVRIAGREDINGKTCDMLEGVFLDQSQYHRGQLFTTVAERLPVGVRVFNKEGAVIKELVFDKLEQMGEAWVVKLLTVKEKNFDYTSTFEFNDVKVNPPLEESLFTPDFLEKGWQESSEKPR